MPWQETGPVELRIDFVHAAMRGEVAFGTLCQAFAISRKTGYKWLERFEKGGSAALVDQRRVAHHLPHKLDEATVAAILAARRRYPCWGPKKLVALLAREKPEVAWPAPSTAGDVLKRAGVIKAKYRRRQWPGQARHPQGELAPNDLWYGDHKGPIVIKHQRCDPLTVTDAASRKVLCAQLSGSTSVDEAKRHLATTFREYGLPVAMQTDNGSPFGSTGLGGLTRLSVWLIRLGITVFRSRPGTPTDNGAHERMHASMEAEMQHVAQRSADADQALATWKEEFGRLRPHEALGMRVPDDVYVRSTREFPDTLPDLEYPDDFELRRVRTDGSIKLRGEFVYLSESLIREVVGLEHMDQGGLCVHLGPLALGYVGRDNRLVSKRERPRRASEPTAEPPHGEALPSRTEAVLPMLPV